MALSVNELKTVVRGLPNWVSTGRQVMQWNPTGTGRLEWFGSPSFTNLNVSGWERVGSLVAPTNTTAGDLTANRIIVPDQTLPSLSGLVNVLVPATVALGDPTILLLGDSAAVAAVAEIRSAAGAGAFSGIGHGGTLATPTRTTNNLNLISLSAGGYDNAGTPARATRKALFSLLAAEDWTAAAQGVYANLALTPIGSTTRAEYYRWLTGGQWIAGYLQVGALSAPTNTTAGDINGVRVFATTIDAATGFRVNGGAASGNVLRGNGTNFVSAQLAVEDLTGTAWSTYTPTITAAIGTFTTVAGSGHYKLVGKTLSLTVTVTITTNGTAAGSITVPLPNSLTAAFAASFAGRETSITGNTCTGTIFASNGNISVQRYDNAYPGANGYIITITGTIEVN